jgi:hypothetical protein
MSPQDLYGWSRSFAIFRGLEDDFLMAAFYDLLREPSPDSLARFSAKLYEEGFCWSDVLEERVLNYPSIIFRQKAAGKAIPEVLMQALRTELFVLEQMAQVSPDSFDFFGYKPGWMVHEEPLTEKYMHRLDNLDKEGFGLLAQFGMHRVRQGVIVPVKSPDPERLEDIIGYDRQKDAVYANMKALAKGKPSTNVLLYGEAGTGKSATIKASCNALKEEGIRLIELSKEDLPMLPEVLEQIQGNPLKFVLFVDDLTFQEDEDSFGSLKAVLEGSASALPDNARIYATSNRRHLVKETFTARQGDEVHLKDTLAQTASLSERFGLRIGYEKPDRTLYLDIVRQLAKKRKLQLDDKRLVQEAERFALNRSGRSGRAARQLVELLEQEESQC